MSDSIIPLANSAVFARKNEESKHSHLMKCHGELASMAADGQLEHCGRVIDFLLNVACNDESSRVRSHALWGLPERLSQACTLVTDPLIATLKDVVMKDDEETIVKIPAMNCLTSVVVCCGAVPDSLRSNDFVAAVVRSIVKPQIEERKHGVAKAQYKSERRALIASNLGAGVHLLNKMLERQPEILFADAITVKAMERILTFAFKGESSREFSDAMMFVGAVYGERPELADKTARKLLHEVIKDNPFYGAPDGAEALLRIIGGNPLRPQTTWPVRTKNLNGDR
jgi:hypothetical protein